MMMMVAPSRPSPTVNIPATPPVRNATLSAAGSEPERAAAAVRTLPLTASDMPMKPVRPERKHPATKAMVRQVPDWAKLRASLPSGRSTAVEVTNTMMARGIRMNAIVLN